MTDDGFREAANAALVDPDSEGCLCIVASYASAAALIADVTKAAASRIMMSPSLGDFLQLRFVDLGPRPGQSDDRSYAVQKVTDELLHADISAGRNYYALLVVDRSAAAIDRVLGSCASAPFLAALRMQFGGIASTDDRSPAEDEDDRALADIVTSPTGAWRDINDLVDVVRQHGEKLLRYFAARHEPGLSPGELDLLRKRTGQPAGDMARADSQGAVEGADVRPDVLALEEVLAPRVTGKQMSSGPHDEAEQDTGPDVTPRPSQRNPERSVIRWLPTIRRSRRHQPGAEGGDGGDPACAPDTRGLAYLLITGDEISAEDPAISRLRSAVLEVDKKLATVPGTEYQVRLLYGDDEALRGGLRPAGQLGRRDVKRSVAATDFASVLQQIRALVCRDLTSAKAVSQLTGQLVARPAVVLFTVDPPLADSVTIDVFRGFITEASVTWVVPRNAELLVSPGFMEAPGARLIIDHEAVADDVSAALGGS